MPADTALEGRIGSAVWLATLKGLDRNLIFLQICNLYTIYFHILSFLSWLNLARILIWLWAPMSFEKLPKSLMHMSAKAHVLNMFQLSDHGTDAISCVL